ncbi:MAG: DUF2062 domain-containing protein [Parcubacteria group bacterium]|jgi:uncharacterized protein (DUF2062 family)
MKKKLKNFFKQFFLINDSPHKVAGGAALGIFLGIVPGEGLITTLLLASLFRLNRLSATAGVLATNMWTTLVVLPIAAAVGGFIFHEKGEKLIDEFQATYHLGFKFFLSKAILLEVALPLVIGFFVVAGAIAAVFYFLLSYLLTNHKIYFSAHDKEVQEQQ